MIPRDNQVTAEGNMRALRLAWPEHRPHWLRYGSGHAYIELGANVVGRWVSIDAHEIGDKSAKRIMLTLREPQVLKLRELIDATIPREPAPVYIVERDSADGPELDVFTDHALALEWAQHIGATVREENAIGRETLDAMKESRPA